MADARNCRTTRTRVRTWAHFAATATACSTLALAGCAHHGGHDAPTYGSIKDEHAAAPRPAAKSARKPARTVAAPTSVVEPAAPVAVQPASAPAAPVTAPAPVAAAPALPPSGGTAPAERITPADLIAEGQKLFDEGKVVEARRRFIAALNGLSPTATLALARSFDTYYLQRLPRSDGAPDMQRALQLYQSAVQRGATEAQADLDRVKASLEQPK